MLIFYLQCFYTMAWTTVQLNNNRQEKTNLLAVAGNTEKWKKNILKVFLNRLMALSPNKPLIEC